MHMREISVSLFTFFIFISYHHNIIHYYLNSICHSACHVQFLMYYNFPFIHRFNKKQPTEDAVISHKTFINCRIGCHVNVHCNNGKFSQSQSRPQWWSSQCRRCSPVSSRHRVKTCSIRKAKVYISISFFPSLLINISGNVCCFINVDYSYHFM